MPRTPFDVTWRKFPRSSQRFTKMGAKMWGRLKTFLWPPGYIKFNYAIDTGSDWKTSTHPLRHTQKERAIKSVRKRASKKVYPPKTPKVSLSRGHAKCPNWICYGQHHHHHQHCHPHNHRQEMLRDSKLNFSYGKYICIDLLPPLFFGFFFLENYFYSSGRNETHCH